MNEEELRSLIRHAIQRQMGSTSAPAPPEALRREAAFGRVPEPQVSISFGQYPIERAADDTMCLIEPAVSCNHCGYCKCHGH